MDRPPIIVIDQTHSRVRATNPAYRALTDEAMLLDSVLEDIEDARDLREARGIIGRRRNDLWTRSRSILRAVEDAAASDDEAPGWNGAGSNVDGVDYEVNRG